MLRTIFKRKGNTIPISATADTFEIEYEPEIVLPPSSGQPKPPGALQTTYEIYYLGSKQVAEAKTISTLIYTIKQMNKKPRPKTQVTFSFAQGTLNVQSLTRKKESVLTLPFYSVALCVLDPTRESGCIAISSTVNMVHEVHVFQGLTHEQAQEVVLGLGLAFSEVGKVQNQVFAENPSLFQWENNQMPRSRVDYNYNSSIVHNPQTQHSPHFTPLPNSDTQKVPAYNAGKGMRPKLKQERAPRSEQSSLMDSVPVTPHTITSADVIQDTTPVDKYESLECRVLSVQQENERLLTCYQRDDISGAGFFIQAVRAVFTSNTLKLTELLKRKNLSLNCRDSTGNSLIHFATLHCNPKMVLFLLKQNADINQGDSHGVTALHRAAANHSVQMVKCLLRHNADINAVDDKGRSPIFMLYVKDTHKGDLVTQLVENGAVISREDVYGLKPADIWMDLQQFQQSLVTTLCNCFMQSVPLGYTPADVLESSSSVTGSMRTNTIPTRHASVLSLQHSDVDTVLMFHNEPLTEEERIAKLEKLRLSSSQFSLVSEDPIAEEARKLYENTAAMVKVGDKMVQHLAKSQPMDPLDLSNIDEVLRQLGVSEELALSPIFYQQLKKLQDDVKRKDWERRKYGHSLKRYHWGMRGLEGMEPRELYLPDGAKLGQLKKSSSETMLHLINASKEVTQRETMDDAVIESQNTQVKPGFMRAMRQLRKPVFSFFTSEATTVQRAETRVRKNNQKKKDPHTEIKSPKLRKRPPYIPKPVNIEPDLDSMKGNSLSSVAETGSENSEIFNKLVSKLDPEGDRMGKITQLPLVEHPSVSDMFKLESFSRAKSIYDPLSQKRGTLPEGWVTSRGDGPVKSQFQIHPDTGKPRSVLSEEPRQRADSEPTKQQFGPTVHPSDREVKREDALKRRSINLSDSTASYRGNRSSVSRPVHLSLGTRHDKTERSNLSAGGNTIIAHPLGLEESSSEPGAVFIFKLLKLSANSECLSYLLAHMGLSKFFKRFLLYSRASGVSEEMRVNMGILINNLFEVMQSESQRKSIEAGMLELVVQLVDSFWPLPGVALSILSNVMDSEWHHNYLTTVGKSPIGPLLRCLNSGIMDTDSGIDSGRKSTSKPLLPRGSIGTSSGSVVWSESTPLRRSQQPEHLPPSRFSKDSTYNSGKDTFDFKKKLDETSEPLRSVLCPISDPKTVILHILSYASHNDTMKSQLISGYSLRVINECLYESNEEHVLLALSTIANVALKTTSHRILAETNLLRKLRSFLKLESMLAYQAARALIYMGEFDVEDVYLFDRSIIEISDSIKYASMEDGTPFVRGGTLEALVEVLTNLPRSLWGGIQLMSPGPKGNGNMSVNRLRHKAVKVEPTEEKIFEFFLTICRSFCEPIILFRLLIHRFRDRFSYSIFDWNLVDLPASRLVYNTLPPTAIVPKTQRLVLRVVQSWLRNFPEDFKKFDYMTDEVKHLLLYPLKKVKGPYYDYGQTIKNLLSQIHIKQRFKEPDPIVLRKPHHHHIYYLCNKFIVEGMLPVKLEDAILLSGLQLYIETIAEKKGKKAFSQDSSKLRNIIPTEYQKVKNVGRRVKDKLAEFTRQQLNERDSKHLYIKHCHELPGFGCQFFAIKEIVLKRKYSPVLSRLLGISYNKIVVLDIHTKDNLIEFPYSTLKSWFPNTEDNTVVLTFKKRRYLFLVQDTSVVTEISNILQQCTDELNSNPIVEKNPLYTSLEQSPRDKKISSLIAHEESPINRMAVDNAPTKARKQSKTLNYLTTDEIESNSSSIASASILPSAEESSDNNSTSFDELMVLAAGVPPTTLSFMYNSEGTHATPKLHPVSSRTSQNGINRRRAKDSPGNGSTDPSPSGLKRISGKLSPRRKTRDKNSRHSPKHLNKRSKSEAKEVDLAIERDIMDWLSQTRTFDPSEQQTATRNEFEVPGGVGMGRQVFCNCPPNPEFSPNLRLDHICLEDLLQSPRELARQITLLDFDLLNRITPEDCLNYVIPEQRRGARDGFNERDAMKLFVDRGNLGKFAFRFGQLSSWVASSVLLFEVLEDRTEALRLFIQTAMECYQLKNYHAVQAIVIGALQSPPIKHLEKTWEKIAPPYKEFIEEISELFEAKNNYAKYRQCIHTTEVPAVPFFLLYLKDLTYIVNANPDYLKGGLINFDKRRLIYARLEEIQYFQSHKYQLKRVPEIRRYLFNSRFIAQEKLVHVAHELESRDGRSGGSQGSLCSEGSSTREVASFYGSVSRNITRRIIFTSPGNANGQLPSFCIVVKYISRLKYLFSKVIIGTQSIS